MKTQALWVLLLAAILSVLNLAIIPVAIAQSQMKNDVEQLTKDLHDGVERSTLTAEQKVQLRDDFTDLKQARQNHDRFAMMRAAHKIRSTLDSGAFKPEDQQRIKQDMQAIKEARKAGSQ